MEEPEKLFVGPKIEEFAKEIIVESPERVEAIEELIGEKAEKLAGEMKDKHVELTGQDSKYEQEGLYRNVIREMLVKYKFLSPEDDAELKERYKKNNKIERLSIIADETNQREDKFKKSTELEDTIISGMRYVQDGWVGVGFFYSQLHSYLSNEALRKKRAQLEVPIQKNLEEPDESSMNGIQKKAEEEKYATFDKMVKDQKNQYATEKQRQIETNFTEWKAAGHNNKEIFHKFNADPALSKDFNGVLMEYRDFHLDLKGVAQIKAETTVRQAELSGLHHF